MKVGTKIEVGKYTATCQKIEGKIATFCMDQYLDETIRMDRDTYDSSDFRKRINSDDILSMFDLIREEMVPFENGDFLRIPYAEELFDPSEIEFVEEKHPELSQWELMKDRRNVVCFRENYPMWGWCRNMARSSSIFAGVSGRGTTTCSDAGASGGVRLVFQLYRF